VDRAARLGDRLRAGIDVGDVDIAEPARPRAGRLHLVGELHRAGDTLPLGLEDGVAHAAERAVRMIRRAPPDDARVEIERRLEVGRHQLVPEKLVGHVVLLSPRCR